MNDQPLRNDTRVLAKKSFPFVIFGLAGLVIVLLSGILYYSQASIQIRGHIMNAVPGLSEISNPLSSLEYTFVVRGTDIFPNESIEHDIVVEAKSSKYEIPRLQYALLNHDIRAADVVVQANPSRIDETRTKVEIMITAKSLQVTGLALNKNYGEITLDSVYGIYDSEEGKMTIHVPLGVAIPLLL